MKREKNENLRIDGKARVLDRLFGMIRNARKDVMITMRYWGSKWGDKKLLNEVIFPDLENSIKHALSKGASVRIMGDLESDVYNISKRLYDLGANVRNFQGGYLRFIVIDGRECLFAISEPYTEETHFYHAIWSTNNVLVDFFKDYFESTWPVCDRIF